MPVKMKVLIADDTNLIRKRLQEMVIKEENEKIAKSHAPDFLQVTII
jgi:chemotaxis response regulator CheB